MAGSIQVGNIVMVDYGGETNEKTLQFSMKPLMVSSVGPIGGPLSAADEKRMLKFLVDRYNVHPSNPGHTPINLPKGF